MPSLTFLNLPIEKQERILRECYREFTKHNYKSASVTRIVDNLGIAKGSMYKYFANKKELYLYLVDSASRLKLQYLSQNYTPDAENFFEALTDIVETGLEFDITHLEYSLFLYRVMADEIEELDQQIGREMLKKSHHFILQYVITAQKRGVVRDDIEAELIANFINHIILSFTEEVLAKVDMKVDELLTQLHYGEVTDVINKGAILQELKKYMVMLRYGIER